MSGSTRSRSRPRSRTHSWARSSSGGSTDLNRFSTISEHPRGVVRQGPICIGLVLLLVIPMLLLSVSETTVVKQKHDLRAGGAWIPKHGNETQPAELIGDKNADTTHPKYQQGMSNSPWKDPEWNLKSRSLGESATSRCDMHTVQLKEEGIDSVVKDWIFLEGQDQVVIAIVDTKRQWIVQRQQRYAIPGGPVLTPVQGTLIPNKESPWDAACRIVWQQTGLFSTTTTLTLKKESLLKDNFSLILDEYGLQDGKVPDKFQRDWTFLGRYRNLGDQGGGFTYSYLLQNAVAGAEEGGSVVFLPPLNNLREQPVLVTMGMQQVKQTLKSGDFPEITAVATMSLALANAYIHDRSFAAIGR